MKIKQDSIREVLEKADIVAVIENYIPLRQSGRNYLTLCPFHKEKTPSFTVSREKGLFHCFGCGVGGNVVSFLMKYDKLTFVDAIEALAKKFGIRLQYESGYYQEDDKELELLYEYSLITSQYFHNNLLETNEGRNALKYLQNRGIKLSTIKAFQIGYALSAWDGLLNLIRKNNYDLDVFEKLGLIIKKDNGEYYDRFRGRIIFPIYSAIGKVIAFGGRILEGDNDQPKYMNSPESRIYIKGKTLYGFFQTKDEIRKKDAAILVEGYMDFLTLFQNGIKNVVASAGTSLTLDQIFILSKATQNINLIFDGDEAGQKAAVRAIQLMLQTETNFKIVTLPEEEDPDSFIQKFGEKKFLETIESGQNYIDYMYNLASEKNSFSDTSSKLKVIDSLLQFTSRVRDELRREIYAREIAKKFNVTESSIIQKLNKYVKNYANMEEREFQYQQSTDAYAVDKEMIDSVSPLEKGILKMICELDQQYLGIIFEHIDENDFINPLAGELFKVLKGHFLELKEDEKINVQYIINKLEREELRSILSDSLIKRYNISDGWNEVEEVSIQNVDFKDILKDSIKKLKIISLNKQIDELNERISRTSDLDEAKNLSMEIKKLMSSKSFYQKNEFVID